MEIIKGAAVVFFGLPILILCAVIATAIVLCVWAELFRIAKELLRFLFF